MSFTFKTGTSAATLAANTETGSSINTDSEGETQKAKAIAFALQESDEMSQAINTVANAKEDWQGGPITVLFALKSTYGEEIDTFPEPDSDTGNNPDKFKLSVEDAQGKSAMRPSSFYLIFSDATKEGKAVCDELAQIKRAGNLEAVKTDVPKSILDMTKEQRDVRANYLTGRRSTIRASYKKAMALYHQLNAVASLTSVGVDFVWQTDEHGEDTNEVENTTKPIMVWQMPGNDAQGNPRPIKDREFFSIGSFLKLEPKKAQENGGTFKALKATVARATGGATGNKDAPVKPVKTAETFVAQFVELFRAMDEFQSDADQKEMGKLMKLLNSKGSDELKVSFVEFRNYLDDICDENKLSPWYADLQAKRSPLVTRKAA